jgi:tRNA 2-thiouridine synthesizing protein A
MAVKTMDLKGLTCPMPALKISAVLSKREVPEGDILEVVADCPTFEKDIRQLCTSFKKTIILFKDEGNNAKRCQIKI